MWIDSYGASLTGNLEMFMQLMDENLMEAAIPQAWFLDKNILLPSSRSQAKKAKLDTHVSSCTAAEQGFAARRLLGLAISKAKEHDIPLDDPKFARRICQRVSDSDRSTAISVAKKFSAGLSAACQHYGRDFTSVLPAFTTGTFDTEIINTNKPEIKGPYWSFFKKAHQDILESRADQEAQQALQELEKVSTGATPDQDMDLDADTRISLQLCWKRLSGPYLWSLKSFWWKQKTELAEVVAKGKEMWVDREDRHGDTAEDESMIKDQYQLAEKGKDPLSLALSNNQFLEVVLAKPCLLFCDLGLADYHAEALDKAAGIFGEHGIVMLLQTGTHEEQGTMMGKWQNIMRALHLAVSACVWVQVEGEAAGVGVHADQIKKQTGALMIFAGSVDPDRNPLAFRVSTSIILIIS